MTDQTRVGPAMYPQPYIADPTPSCLRRVEDTTKQEKIATTV